MKIAMSRIFSDSWQESLYKLC